MQHILIVGRKISTITHYLEENGYEFTYLQDIKITKFPDKKFKNRILGDFSSKESILNSVSNLKKRPDAVIATYENYVLPAAWIAEYLNITGLPVAAAEACTDKYIMRSLFAKAPEKISPGFAIAKSEEDVRAFANLHDFPIILKPANLAKSLLVTKSSSIEELIENYRKTVELLPGVYKRYAPNRTPKLVIEEFLEGSIHSVDAFIDTFATPHVLDQIVDYQTGYDIGYDDNFHYSRILPSVLSEEDQNKLKHCAEVGIRALGIANSPAHVEIIMTKDGPRIVEIGARNGGYRERMHMLANGIDITGNALKVALGEQPQLEATKNEPCAVLELFPKQPGTFAEIINEEALKKLPSLYYFDVKAKAGQYIGKSSDGYKMAAVIILNNSNVDQFNSDLRYISEHVSVQTN